MRSRRARAAVGGARQARCRRRLERLWDMGMPVLPQAHSRRRPRPARPVPALAGGLDAAELLLRSGSAERPRCAAWVGLDEGRLGRSEQLIAAAVQGDLERMGYLLSQARQPQELCKKSTV